MNKPTKKRAKNAVDAPFDPAIWKEAQQIAATYQMLITTDPDLGYFGRTVEMPMVMADGKTLAACAKQVLEATTLTIASVLEDGESPPRPASEGKRDQQVNLRLTGLEKLELEAAANREGYRSVSDFIRSAALGRASGR